MTKAKARKIAYEIIAGMARADAEAGAMCFTGVNEEDTTLDYQVHNLPEGEQESAAAKIEAEFWDIVESLERKSVP